MDELLNKIHIGDCARLMARWPSELLDMAVLSPPYGDLRDYHGVTLDLPAVGNQLYRLLKSGGIAAVVMQDSTRNFSKSLATFRAAVDWCDNVGFKVFETCIYRKDGVEGAWWSQRFRVDHEYILLFLKGERPAYFDKEALKIPSRHAGKVATCAKRLTDGTTKQSNPFVVRDMKCRGTVWEYTPCGPQLKRQHPASFPDQLPYDLIRCFCPPDGVVCDPYMGSGTTARAAIRLGRDWIGCEISKEYTNEIANVLIAREYAAVREDSESDPSRRPLATPEPVADKGNLNRAP